MSVDTVPLPASSDRSYYDLSLLKAPVWGGEVAAYFFLGGLSGGAFLIARVAEWVDRNSRLAEITRCGTYVAFLTVLPCAPLLARDLGDRSRFHHMLRVFKPTSPMNLGAWTLLGYSGAVTLAALREGMRGPRRRREASLPVEIGAALLRVVSDAVGVPMALLLCGYTGVLLSTTSTPVWAKNPWLGPLFSAGALGSGAAAIQLALGEPLAGESCHEALDQIHTTAHAAEAVCLAGYLARAGSLAKPLFKGRPAPVLAGAVGGLLLSEGLKRLHRRHAWSAAVAGLAGAFCLRWTMVHAGPVSANDPRAARESSRRRPSRSKAGA